MVLDVAGVKKRILESGLSSTDMEETKQDAYYYIRYIGSAECIVEKLK